MCGVTLNPVALIQVPKRRTISESDGILENKPLPEMLVSGSGSITCNGSVQSVQNKAPSPGYTDKVSSSWNGLTCERQMSWPQTTANGSCKKLVITPAASFTNVTSPGHQSSSNGNNIVLEMESLPS